MIRWLHPSSHVTVNVLVKSIYSSRVRRNSSCWDICSSLTSCYSLDYDAPPFRLLFTFNTRLSLTVTKRYVLSCLVLSCSIIDRPVNGHHNKPYTYFTTARGTRCGEGCQSLTQTWLMYGLDGCGWMVTMNFIFRLRHLPLTVLHTEPGGPTLHHPMKIIIINIQPQEYAPSTLCVFFCFFFIQRTTFLSAKIL